MTRAEQRQFGRRRLRLETLENRRVLAGGLGQNIIDPEDTSGDGYVTPLDALVVVNAVNDGADGDSDPNVNADVNGDGVVSPGDALFVINRLNSRSPISGVPIATRIANLEKALSEGKVPNGFSLDAANEILATLRNGGRPELGDRFRNGKMINLKDLPEQLADGGPNAEAPEPAPAPNAAVSEPVEPEPLTADMPVDLEVALEDDAPDAVDWWNALLDDLSALDDGAVDDHVRPLLVEGFQGIYDDAAMRPWLDQEQISHWISELESNESIPQDVLMELAAYTSTLGDMHEQIAQMFANFDFEAIMEYLPNLEIIVEAVTPEYSKTEIESKYEAALAELLSGGSFLILH